MALKHTKAPVFILLSGTAAFFLGALVLYGWYTRSELLVQVVPNFAPMQYNTALGFLLSGLGVLALNWKNFPLSGACGILVTLLGFLTLTQYVFNSDFGIDQLFMEHYIMTKTSHPGRMAPNTALCFLLCGLSLVLSKNLKPLLIGLATAVFVLSLLALSGYLIIEESIYGWGNLTRMAIHTAVGFIILSIGLIAFALSQSAEKFGLIQLTPITLTVVLAALTLFSWYSIKESINGQNQEHFNTLVLDTQTALKNRYLLYEQALWGGLGLFYASKSVERNEWQKYANSISMDKSLPGMRGIGYIDYVEENDLGDYLAKTRQDDAPEFTNHPNTTFKDKFIIRFSEPVSDNKEALGLDIGFEKNRREAAEYARDYGVPAITQKIELVQDNKKQAGFLLLIPVYDPKSTPSSVEERRAHLSGWVYAPFIGPDFMQGIRGTSHDELDFAVYDGENMQSEELIYKTNSYDFVSSTNSDLKAQTALKIASHVWTLNWYPSDQFRAPGNQNVATLVLVFGFFLTALVSYVLNSLIRSKDIIAAEVEKQTAKVKKSEEEIREAKQFQDLIMDTMPDLIFVKDQEFRIVEANPAFINLYPEHKRQNIIGKTTLEEYDEEEAETFLIHDKKALQEGYSETEETVTFPNGETRTLFTKKTKFETPAGEKFILGVGRDITAIKAAEEELTRSNIELERFAYVASHDLQEPLRMVKNFTELLEKKYANKLDEQAREYIAFATNSAHRMQELVDDLLEYARIGEDAERYSEVNFDKIVGQVEINLKEAIESTKAKIVYKNLPAIQANPVRITRLLQNLVSNSLKYQAEGKIPEIQINAERKDDEWLFSIKDNGIGMKQEYCEKIFEPFKRLHGKEEYAGTGMGLAICRKIVEGMNGKIWATSELEKGSIFYFSLPEHAVDLDKNKDKAA